MKEIDVVHIEDSVPVPVKKPNMSQILRDMTVGQSFEISDQKAQSLRTTVGRMKHDGEGEFLVKKSSGNHVRVWRIK